MGDQFCGSAALHLEELQMLALQSSTVAGLRVLAMRVQGFSRCIQIIYINMPPPKHSNGPRLPDSLISWHYMTILASHCGQPHIGLQPTTTICPCVCHQSQMTRWTTAAAN